MVGFSETNRITASNLIKEIEKQRDLMISVSTGGPKIDSVNDEYRSRRNNIKRRLEVLGIEDPNPFYDLWEWYGRWSGGDFPSYRLRRSFLRELYKPLLSELEAIESGVSTSVIREPTGWPLVDQQMEKMKAQLARAKVEIDFQTVGLIAREILISLSQAVFDPDKHKTKDGLIPSENDAGDMLEAFISSEMKGSAQEETRRYAKASLSLALALQHKRTADFKMAALCSEATSSVVNIVAIMTGRREPQ
jgi:hypothetical protein